MKFLKRAVLVAGLAAGLVAAPARAADVDPLLPADSEAVMFLNVRQILDSDLVKKYALGQIKQMLDGGQAKEMMADLGLDPLKDIDKVSAGIWGDNPQEAKFLFVVRGKFDPEKLFKQAEIQAKKDGDKMSIVKEGEYTLIKVTPDNRPEPIYASVADEKTIIVGADKKSVVAAMGAAKEKASKTGIKKGLLTLVAGMDEKASMYICGVSSGKIGDIPANPLFDNPEKLKKQLEKIETSALTLRVAGDVTLEIGMAMKDADAADDFGGTLDELLGKAKAFLPFLAMQNANMKPIVGDISKTLKSKVKDKTITVTAKLSGDSIGKAAGADD